MKKILLKLFNLIIREKKNLIHAESIVRDDEWDILKKEIGKDKIWFIITPANYDYCKIVLNLKIGKDEFTKVLKQRIKFLKEKRENLQFSIFLCKVKKFLDNKLQEEKFREAFEFLKELNIKPNKFYPIDLVYNNYTLKLAKKYGLLELTNFNLFIVYPILKIIKYFGIKLSFVKNLYNFLKIRDFKNVFYLILGELKDVKEKTLHAEAFMKDDLWNSLKKNIIGRGYTWFVITPANYDYCKTYFNLKMDKDYFSETLKKRIIDLLEKKEEIHLHIHFCDNIKFLDFSLQKEKFSEAMKFITELGLIPNKFVPGWWVYNRDTIKLSKKYGFKEISAYSINPFLKSKTLDGINIKFTHKYWHDFEFI